MNLFKLLGRIKTHLYCIAIFCSILALFAITVNYQLSKSNVDYTIRDYAARTLNQSNYGIWRKIDTTNTSLFSQKTGDSEFMLKGDLQTLEDSLFQKGFDKLIIHLHERIEISSTNASIHLKDGTYDIKKDCISFPPQEVEVRTIKADDFFEIKKCNIQAQMKLFWSQSTNRYKEHIFVESEDCMEFMLAVKGNLLSQSLKESQVIMHFLFSIFIICAQVVTLIMIDLKLQNNILANQQLSTTTILILGTLQLVLGFEQLVLSLFDFPYFFCMVLIGIFYFNIFFFLVLKTVASSVRYQIFYRLRNEPNFNVRSYLLFVYCQAHITILGTFLISLKMINSPNLFMLWAMALVPQIIKNSLSRTRFLASQNYLTLFYVLTMIYSLYMHFFKYNFFSVNNDYNTFNLSHVLNIGIFSLFQVLFITCQQTLHPAFFVPVNWRVIKTYDYFFNIKELTEGKWKHKHNEQCIICFSSLDKNCKSTVSCDLNSVHGASMNPNTIAQANESISENKHHVGLIEDPENPPGLIPLPSVNESEESVANWREVITNEALRDYLDTQIENKKFMGTPCDHVFHSACLLVWMGQKMECPVCRSELPSIC